VFLFPAVNFLYIPWDFVLILALLGVVLPWRGVARMKRFLSKPDLTAADRLSLYGSTILFQWLIVLIVVLRCAARTVGAEELGVAAPDSWQVAWTSVGLATVLSTIQVIGLRRMRKVESAQRGALFRITEKIMPRTLTEFLVYAALACTAGVSEEFLYRGFVFTAFVRMIVNFGAPNGFAVILSSAWFALAHLYQGRKGVITTFVVVILFAAMRLWTGSIIPAITAHIGIDLVAGIVFLRARPEA
jgi:membrane protease YdiL (CAAX protease family)